MLPTAKPSALAAMSSRPAIADPVGDAARPSEIDIARPTETIAGGERNARTPGAAFLRRRPPTEIDRRYEIAPGGLILYKTAEARRVVNPSPPRVEGLRGATEPEDPRHPRNAPPMARWRQP